MLQCAMGDTVRIAVPGNLAFGSRGVPGRVPAGSSLVFEIEITSAPSLEGS